MPARPGTPYSYAKVFGERGSGTNLVERLLRLNFDVKLVGFEEGYSPAQSALLDRTAYPRIGLTELVERVQDASHLHDMERHAGWKHACLGDEVFRRFPVAEETLFVCAIRHPALWIASLHRRPFHSYFETPESLSDFMRHPWATRPRDGIAEVLLESPLLLWRHKVASYLAAAGRGNVLVIRHEDILRDHAAVLSRIAGYLAQRQTGWQLPEGDARPFVEDGAGFEAHRDALPEDPFATVSEEDAVHIRSVIGPDLLALSGYASPMAGSGPEPSAG